MDVGWSRRGSLSVMKIAVVAGECRGYITHTGLDLIVRSLGLQLRKIEEVEAACILIPYLGSVGDHSDYCTTPEFHETDNLTNSEVWQGRLCEDAEKPDD